MDKLSELVAVREICELKARYFRFVDTRNWDDLRGCFTKDATVWFPESGMAEAAPMADALPHIIEYWKDAISGHHGHMPEIAFQSDDRATGIWAMQDVALWPAERAAIFDQKAAHGFGHYYEDYSRVDGRWYIQTLKLTRLFFERERPTISFT